MAESDRTLPDNLSPEVRRTGRMRGLLTTRIISLLDLLRRSGTLANKRAFGLSGMEWRIMAQVGEHAPLTLIRLAELLTLDPGQLSRAVKAMAERGILSRKRRPGGPAIMITLSEEGEALYEGMVGLAAARNEFLVGDLAPEDVAKVTQLLDAIMHRAELLLEQERAASDPRASELE